MSRMYAQTIVVTSRELTPEETRKEAEAKEYYKILLGDREAEK